MILWLDDIREPWKHGYSANTEWAKTPEEAIRILQAGNITFASLDHDMNADQMFGEYKPGVLTGFDVLYWLSANQKFWPRDGVKVHSANSKYRPLMEEFIRRSQGTGA